MHLLMASDAAVEALLDDNYERLAQRVGHVDGRRVVVEPAAASADVILAEHGHIQYHDWTLLLRASMRVSARSPNVTGARPGGQLRHFWVPL